MTPALFVVDNALSLPDIARAVAVSKQADYRDEHFEGHVYAGVALPGSIDLQPVLTEFFRQRATTRLSYLRLGLAQESVPSRIHADTSIPAAWATVLYLNEGEQVFGGTAFWKHKWLGLDYLPRETDQDVVDIVNADGDDSTKWELGTVVAMKPNRLIIYPTEYFHSRWPLKGYGEGVDTGRRVHVSFFDLE